MCSLPAPLAPGGVRPSGPVGSRAISVLLRSVHVATMALIVGGVAVDASLDSLRLAIYLTVGSGVLLMFSDLLGGRMALTHGSGVVMLLKLALLAVGMVIPAQRLAWFLASTIVAGLGAHMPATWRHFSFVRWRVIERRRHAPATDPDDR